MKQTPLLHDGYNLEIFDLIPKGLSRIVEVGCGNGALAKAYLESNEKCEYIGIEIDKVYAELAKKFCKKVICCNFEVLNDSDFFEIFPADCVVFGDSLEHLYDPWAVLMRVRKYLVRDGCVIACIPNMQHWSIQAGLNVAYLPIKIMG